MSLPSWLTGIISFVTDIAEVVQRHVASAFAREFFGKGITDYDAFVYPKNTALFLGYSQATPIYGNIEFDHEVYISSWNCSIFTANATGLMLMNSGQDPNVNDVVYYGNAYQVHGKHEFIVESFQNQQTPLINTYRSWLAGALYYATLSPTQSDFTEVVLSNAEKQIGWMSHFLVVPNCPAFFDDMTRNHASCSFVLLPKSIFYMITTATTIFFEPEGNSTNPNVIPPMWFRNLEAIINVSFFFCGKVLQGDGGLPPIETLTQHGNPTNTKHPVTTELPIMVAPPGYPI